jgi:hypothetical protein
MVWIRTRIEILGCIRIRIKPMRIRNADWAKVINNFYVSVLMCLRDEKADVRMAVLELIYKLVTDR